MHRVKRVFWDSLHLCASAEAEVETYRTHIIAVVRATIVIIYLDTYE